MPNIPDNIRQNASKCIKEGNTELFKLIITGNPDLIHEKSKADNSTLFIKACRYLRKDIIEFLLNTGIDVTATDHHGRNGIMYLLDKHNTKIQDVNEHDAKAAKILNLFKENNILKEQLLYESNNKKNVLQIALKEKFFNQELTQESTKIFIDTAININEPTTKEKKELLSLIKECLSKLNLLQITELVSMILPKNVYEPNISDNREYLQNEYARGQAREKLFNSIDVELIELLYIIGGINLNNYKPFINSLYSVEDACIKEQGNCSVVILRSNKQKILKIIDASNSLTTLAQNSKELNCKEEDVVTTKDLALKRFCFLVANKENLEISKESEAAILLDFINFANNVEEFNYNIYDNFKKYLMNECKTLKKLKKVLDIYGDKITEIIKFEPDLINKLNNLVNYYKNFEEDTDILTNEIEKLLNPDLNDVLPRNVFLNLIDNKKEENINETEKKLIEANLKFFTVSNTFEIPEYENLDQNIFKFSIEYYQNNQESLIPNLVLLKTANDYQKISKLKEILDNQYLKVKSTVSNCLNIISTYSEYYKSLKYVNLDTNTIGQNLLTDKIKEVLNDSKVEEVKNNALLCKKIGEFLNIAPIASLFEAYNNYQGLESEVHNAQKVLGNLGIEWSFDIS